jgi:hypothetical protein
MHGIYHITMPIIGFVLDLNSQACTIQKLELNLRVCAAAVENRSVFEILMAPAQLFAHHIQTQTRERECITTITAVSILPLAFHELRKQHLFASSLNASAE